MTDVKKAIADLEDVVARQRPAELEDVVVKKPQAKHSYGPKRYVRNPNAKPRTKVRRGGPMTCVPTKAPFAVLPTRALTDPNVTDLMFRTLAVIAAYSNRAGIAWPSLDTIEAHIDLKAETVHAQVTLLVKYGHLEKLGRYTVGGIAYSNTYRIIYDPNISAEDALAAQTAVDLQNAEDKGVAPAAEINQKQVKPLIDQGQPEGKQVPNDVPEKLGEIEEVVVVWLEASRRWGRPRPDADATRSAARTLVLEGVTARTLGKHIDALWAARRPLPIALAGVKAGNLKV